jgi:hypothetical protein
MFLKPYLNLKAFKDLKIVPPFCCLSQASNQVAGFQNALKGFGRDLAGL